MDKLADFAAKGMDAYNKSHSDVNKTGGQEYNSPHNAARSDQGYGPDINHDEAVRNAEESGSGDSSLFSSALSFVNQNKSAQEEPLNDEEVTRAHDKVYKENDTSGMSSELLGSAAALEIVKRFTGGGSSSQGTSDSSSHGGEITTMQLISMAVAEATKLFDKSGGKASGNKQDAANGAAMAVVELVQSKFSGAGTTGGGHSGGLSSMFRLATKFAQ